MKDAKYKLSTLSVVLHWVVGLTIIGLIAMGLYMKETNSYDLYDIHKSIGVLIFFVIIARVLWRVKNGWPEPVSVYSRIEQKLSKAVHWALILGTLAMPVSGMVMSAMGGNGFGVFGLEIVAENPHPTERFEVIPRSESLAEAAEETHELIGWIMIWAILLHLIGGLKHHFVDKDGTLRRMLGKVVE